MSKNIGHNSKLGKEAAAKVGDTIRAIESDMNEVSNLKGAIKENKAKLVAAGFSNGVVNTILRERATEQGILDFDQEESKDYLRELLSMKSYRGLLADSNSSGDDSSGDDDSSDDNVVSMSG